MIDLVSPTDVKKLMDKHRFKIRKSLGQNFLVDANIVNKILNSAELNNDDIVVEIGPGLGVLTKAAASKAKRVIALEIDRRLESVLNESLQGLDNVEVVYQDAMCVDVDSIVEQCGHNSGSYKVIANLPYYITTPLIMYFLETKFKFSFMLIMVQHEVAQRISALPGGKEYGALSVAVQYYTEPKYLFKVPGTVFIPRPEVDSAVICLKKRDKPAVDVPDEALFFKVVKGAFGQRRKNLLNALGAAFNLPKNKMKDLLERAGIESTRRGETLSLLEFAAISKELHEYNCNC